MSAAGDDPGDQEGHEPPGDASNPESPMLGLGAFAALGSTIAVIEAVGVVGGIWVDHLLSSSPWGLLIGIVLATVTAVVSVMKQVRRFL